MLTRRDALLVPACASSISDGVKRQEGNAVFLDHFGEELDVLTHRLTSVDDYALSLNQSQNFE